ncbi:MAG: 4-phosphoerythronate dehydrogenase [Chitinispirillaceae bacterium]|nr:4-phosphoerythronate dehydrogenase [Chitinispirillaceae bacterium]
MKIVVDENIPLAVEAFSTFGEVTAVAGREIDNKLLADAEMLLVRSVTPVDGALLEGTPVKFVASATIGIDHIDTVYLKEHNIGFAHAPGSNADSVAEYILAALCVISGWGERKLSEMTLGIIGVGNIGSRVFRHALTLGMNPVLCDPPKKRLLRSEMYRPLQQVLETSDIITLHVPLTTSGEDATVEMVNRNFLASVKRKAVLINTSRGKVIDSAAVLDRRKDLGGLVLDVWENEPGISADLVNVTDIATPHIAGYSYDGKVRGTKAVYDAACAWFFKQPEWEPDITDAPVELQLSEEYEPFSNAILQAYPIENDDRALRKIISLEKDEQPRYFDELRRTYPKRREFPSYSIRKGSCSGEVLEKLRRLGFSG